MSFRSYTIILVFFGDQLFFERTPNNFDMHFRRKGEVDVNKKLTNGFSDPENPENDDLKKINKR